MEPSVICQSFLGPEKLTQLLESLSTPQVKTVLKKGGLKVKLPGSYTAQQKRRRIWAEKVTSAINGGNQDAASEFLQQWLLNKRRGMLMDYLDQLGVKHNAGETDEGFLSSVASEQARSAAARLLKEYPADEAASYLSYIAYQQKSAIFEQWAPMQALIRSGD